MVNLSLTEALQAMQSNITENVGINDPTNYSRRLGLSDYLFSPANPRTITTSFGQASRDGKYKPVEIRTLAKKSQADLINEASDYSCARVTTRRELITTLNPTLIAGDRFGVDEAIIREGTQQEINARIAKEVKDAMLNGREEMDRALFSAANGLVGANPANGSQKDEFFDVEMLNADGTLDSDVFDRIANDQVDNFQLGDVALIGNFNIRKVVNRLAVGSTTDGGVNFGDVNTQFGMNLFIDDWTNTIHTTANQNRVLAFSPGLAQPYFYNFYNAGIKENTPGLSIKTTVPDSVYPFSWDLHLKWDDGCDTNNPQSFLVGNLFVYFDLFAVDEAAFGDGYTDNLNDYNGITGYNITQASS